MVHNDLSKSDLKLMLDIIHESVFCNDKAKFNALLNKMKALVHFSYARCTFGDSRDFAEQKMGAFEMISCFPDEWEERYAQKEYFLADNIVHMGLQSDGPVFWADHGTIDGMSDKRNQISREMLSEAASIGLKDGWLHCIMGRRSTEFACISLAGDDLKKTCDSEIVLEHLLPHLCQAVKRVISGQNTQTTGLTKREREILSWTAAGKSAWDISMILNISRRTVEYHMANVLKKLDAVNASQAVANAFSSGLIEY